MIANRLRNAYKTVASSHRTFTVPNEPFTVICKQLIIATFRELYVCVYVCARVRVCSAAFNGHQLRNALSIEIWRQKAV